jgi:hypothetical protein
VLCRGGFFEGDDDFCQALIDGGCVKALQLQLARDVEGAQFVEALEEALAPRMRLMGGGRWQRAQRGALAVVEAACCGESGPVPQPLLQQQLLASRCCTCSSSSRSSTTAAATAAAAGCGGGVASC